MIQPERGDVVRSADPFKLGEDRQRPWLIVNNTNHPFHDEQFVAVAVSTKEYDESIPLSAGMWEVGGVPRESFISPWAVHSRVSRTLSRGRGGCGTRLSTTSSTQSRSTSADGSQRPVRPTPPAADDSSARFGTFREIHTE